MDYSILTIWTNPWCLVCFTSPELKAHWWAYSTGMPTSYINIVKHLSHWANWSQISYGLHGLGERKFVQWVVTWPLCPYMVKTIENLQNRMAKITETWYAALGTQVLPSLFKWWPHVDLWPFYAKVKFGSVCFYIGKPLDSGNTCDVSKEHQGDCFKGASGRFLFHFREINLKKILHIDEGDFKIFVKRIF